MRFRSLRAFRYVMESGTVAAAAERLHLSQPAVSRLISGLEAELGVAFFVRKGRTLVPTQEGIRLFEETQGVLAAIDQLPVVAREIKENSQRRLRLVSMPRLASSVAIPAMGMIQRASPDLRCDLLVLDRGDMEKWITSHEFDVGFAVLPIDNRAVDIIRIGNSPVYVLAAADHRLGGLRSIDFTQVIDEPVIALPDGSRDRRDMDALFQSHSAKPRIRSVVPTVEAAAALAATGVGITFAEELSISVVRHLGLSIIPVNPTWHLAFGLFRPAHRRLSPAVYELIAAVETRLEQIRAPFQKGRPGRKPRGEASSARPKR